MKIEKVFSSNDKTTSTANIFDRQEAINEIKTSSTVFDSRTFFEGIGHCEKEIGQLANRIELLENGFSENRRYLRESSALFRISRIAIILLILVPVIQFIISGVVIYYLGIEENLNHLLNKALSEITIVSIIDIFFVIIFGIKLNERIKKIEDIVDKNR